MGFDNVEASQYCYPELTTVDVLISEQGVFMTNDLLAQIKNKRPPMQRRIPAELVVRQSTGVNKGKRSGVKRERLIVVWGTNPTEA